MARSKKGPKRPLGNHEVGYCKPPKHTRWQKGQSGNLRGRPPNEEQKDTPAAILDRLLNGKVMGREGTGTREVTRLEVLFIRAYEKASKGDLHSFKFLIEMRQRFPSITPDMDDAKEIDADDLKIVEEYLKRLKDEGDDEDQS